MQIRERRGIRISASKGEGGEKRKMEEEEKYEEECEHEWVSDGEIHLDCLGECYKLPVKCKKCGKEADEVYIYSCTVDRETGKPI